MPGREPVPEDEFRRRIEALYGQTRASKLFSRWKLWAQNGRESEVSLERDRLLKRRHDLGQFVKEIKKSVPLICEAVPSLHL